MNRYPEKQKVHDRDDEKSHGRKSVLRPGDRVKVQGMKSGAFGPEVPGRVLVARVSEVLPEIADAVLVSTREYGRRWFHTQGHPFRVLEELD